MIDWLRNPQYRVRAAVSILVGSLVGWPVTQLTVARDEPPFVLALSWLAIIITCLDVVATTDVRRTVDE